MSKHFLSALVSLADPKDKDAKDKPKGPNSEKLLNPTLGDHAFYTYCVPGAVFEAKDGTQWDLEDIQGMGYVRIRNRWYPREEVTCHISDIRRTIHAWIEPVQQIVPELLTEEAK